MTALRRSALLLLAVALSAATACASIDAPGTAGSVGTGEPASVETEIGDATANQSEPINQVTENTASIPPYEDTIVGEWVKARVDHHLLTEDVLVFHPDGRYESSVVLTDLSRLATGTWDANLDAVAGSVDWPGTRTGTYLLDDSRAFPYDPMYLSCDSHNFHDPIICAGPLGERIKYMDLCWDEGEGWWTRSYILENGQLTFLDSSVGHKTFTRRESAAPLDSLVPLDSLPTPPADTKIVGTWQHTNASDGSVNELILHPDGRYNGSHTYFSKDGYEYSPILRVGTYFIKEERGIKKIKIVAVNGLHWPYVNETVKESYRFPDYEWHYYAIQEDQLVITQVFDVWDDILYETVHFTRKQ